MSSWIIALLFAIGTTGFAFTKLVRANGNASPSQNISGAAIAGVIVFIVVFTLLKFTFKFD